MPREQHQLLALLRAYFTDGSPDPCTFADTDWAALCREARLQTVSGFACTAMLRLPQELRPDAEFCAAWERETMRGYLVFGRFFEAQNALCRLLQENGIPVLVWKGLAAAAYLPEPELRTLGDIDVLLPREQMPQAIAVLTAHGYAVGKGTEDSELHVAAEKEGIHFELHRTVAGDIHLPNDYLRECFTRGKTVHSAYGTFPAPEDTDHAFAMLLHMLRHFVSSGFGLRQLYDWAFCLQNGEIDRARLLEMARTAGAEKFLNAVTALCIRCFGLSASHDWGIPVSEAAVEGLLEDILIGGNWGSKEENRTYSLVFSETNGRGLRPFTRKLNRLAGELCPGVKKYPAMQPLLWMPALARFAYHVAIGKQKKPGIGAAKEIAARRRSMMRELGLETEQKRG